METDSAEELRSRTVETVKIGGVKGKCARELEARLARDKELEKMERQTTTQLHLMGKGKVRKVRRKDEDSEDEDHVPLYKWAPQRQK
jgi:Utp11 protein